MPRDQARLIVERLWALGTTSGAPTAAVRILEALRWRSLALGPVVFEDRETAAVRRVSDDAVTWLW